MRTHHKLKLQLKHSLVTLGQQSLGEVVVGSLDVLRRIGMGSLLVLFCNVRSYVIDLSYSHLYLHDLYPAVSDIEFMISLLCYYMLCLVRDLVLVDFYMLQYSYVCSSMMSIHPKGGTPRGILQYRLLVQTWRLDQISVAECRPFPRFVEVAYRQ